jgi:hypothetical protein
MMKVSPHFLRLYYKTARRYKKLTKRLKKQVSTGEFQQKSDYYRKEFFFQLDKLRKKLLSLRGQVKLAAAAGATALVLSATSASAQFDGVGPYQEATRDKNPLPPPFSLGTNTTPVPIDLDGDRDMDLVVGTQGFSPTDGYNIRYFKNVGTRSHPLLREEEYYRNPFFYFFGDFDRNAAPGLGDIDGDGDIDAVVGLSSGEIRYFRNNGFKDADETSAVYLVPEFVEETGPYQFVSGEGTGNPFDGFDIGGDVAPTIVDIDNDGDNDVFFGTGYDYSYSSSPLIKLYLNDGEGNFSEQNLSGLEPPYWRITVATLDYNGDGDIDVVTGNKYGELDLFINNGLDDDGYLVFEQQNGVNNPFEDIYAGNEAAPAFVDFDNDADYDLLIGANNKYSSRGNGVFFFKNEGSFDLAEQEGLFTPLGGVEVNGYASPEYFLDENGVPSFIIGSASPTDGQVMKLYKKIDGFYQEIPSEENPFASLNIPGRFTPSIIDIDGDTHPDLVGANQSQFLFFKNNDGAYEEIPQGEGPFAGISMSNGHSEFADLDNDGDYDLIIGDYYYESGSAMIPLASGYRLRYFENVGAADSPEFTERFAYPDYPFSNMQNETYPLYPSAVDIDGDGDLDIVAGEGGYYYEGQSVNNGAQRVLIYENYGTEESPNLYHNNYNGFLVDQYTSAIEPSSQFLDADDDGDMDVVMGDASGIIKFFENDNPAPVTKIDESTITIFDTSGEILIDSHAVITDADNDDISKMIVTISNFTPSDTLTFTQPNIDESNHTHFEFDDASRKLTIIGKQSRAWYQAILRKLKFKFDILSPGAARRPETPHPSGSATKDISIRVFDVDGTDPIERVKSFVIGNSTPVLNSTTITGYAGAVLTLDLKPLTSDAEDADEEMTYTIISNPASGAVGAISSSQVLTIDYTGLRFVGSESISIQVCDVKSACVSADFSISITNTPPSAAAKASQALAGGLLTIDLKDLISDPENNLVLSTLKIKSAPASGATASIDADGILTVDYTGLNFTGDDAVTFEICDVAGVCAENTITISIPNTAPVVTASSSSIGFGKVATIPLVPLISDAENNIDLTTIRIVQHPSSGASASIDANHNLVVDYTGKSFAGTDAVTIEACDLGGICSQSIISITVNNDAPIISAVQLHTTPGSSVSIDLFELASDSDDNLDINAFIIVSPPESGALAEIANGRLNLNYAGIIFKGTDRLTIRACDKAGACSNDAVISIDVHSEAEVEVFNAVAPNGSSAENRYLHISGLPENHKVTIFNRWGDKVYETVNYDNETVRFEGRNDNGNELASGTYFYVVEFEVIIRSTGPSSATTTDRRIKNGYLTLKQ